MFVDRQRKIQRWVDDNRDTIQTTKLARPRKSFNKNSASPDQDGFYTTRQIAGAVYGGALSEEKLRTQRQMPRHQGIRRRTISYEELIMSRAKVVLITGCSSGFGRLMAETLARKSYQVFATMRAVKDRNSNDVLIRGH